MCTRVLDGVRRDPTVDVGSKVNLADVVVAQHRGVSCVWRVVGSTVVDGAAGGKGQAGLEPVLLDEPPGAVLQLLTAEKRQERGDYEALFSGHRVYPGETLPAAMFVETGSNFCTKRAPQARPGGHSGP